MRVTTLFAAGVAAVFFVSMLHASDTPPPTVRSITVSNNVKTIEIGPAPAIETYNVRSSVNVTNAFTNDNSGVLNGFTFKTTNSTPMKFYSVSATPMSSNALVNANLLNRIAYGPTPDELERLAGIGPEAYIAEQLAPETITDTLDSYTVEVTNAAPAGPPEWRQVVVTGTFSASNLYVYMISPGEAYIDDIELRAFTNYVVTNINGTNITYTTNSALAENVVMNGDFENATLTPPWVRTANVISSSASTTYAHGGSQSLRLISSAAGSTITDSLWQSLTNLNFNFGAGTQRAQLSFWYLEATNSSRIKIRLSGNGVVASGNDAPPPPRWIYATHTGRANNTPQIYMYLSGSGECYIDDVKLVAGSVPESGVNLARNGDFEAALHTNNWSPVGQHAASALASNFVHSGTASLKLICAVSGNGTITNGVVQTNLGTINNGTYTVSFWYLPPSNGRTLTVRLSGSGVNAVQPDSSPGTIRRRFETMGSPSYVDGSVTVQNLGGAQLQDLRSYLVQNCVGSKRQLLYVLLQFLENHFVTQNSKSVDYFDRFYDSGTVMDTFATDWEYRELTKWRAALLNANCNFYDLLRIHGESPAEIVYLDSVDSNGSGNNVANENYAREIMELFAMGVDNGYDQQDITVMSRSWSGWSVQIVDPWNLNNPHALQTTRVGFYPGVSSVAVSNLVGVWTFNYKPSQHGSNRAPVWCVWNSNTTNPQPIGVKTVPARFGSPWAGQAYNLYPIGAVPVRTGTNGIQDGYDVLAKIADLPFTMEYISVKLCRLFVHDEFEHGVYDYTDPNRSAEVELIRQCMVAWNTPAGDGRKGNIRAILNTIFSSDLFRSHGGSMQKVKTPLEYAVSTVRALRASNGTGGYTANTDGYSISGRSRTSSSAPLTRMGSMMLFDRDAPDGFPEAGPPWISAGTLAERVRFVQSALMATSEARKNDDISGGNNTVTDPVALLKLKLPSNQWNNAGAVADYFLSILYPAEGKGNLGALRQLAIDFLNSPDAGGSPVSTEFASLNNTQGPYDTRVRAMVSMLMTQGRFNEQ
jgi:uncharacterized protein (DUF1800 family)